jgi:hypothetical protein
MLFTYPDVLLYVINPSCLRTKRLLQKTEQALLQQDVMLSLLLSFLLSNTSNLFRFEEVVCRQIKRIIVQLKLFSLPLLGELTEPVAVTLAEHCYGILPQPRRQEEDETPRNAVQRRCYVRV